MASKSSSSEKLGHVQSLLDAGLVDDVEVAIIPIILGGGIRLVPSALNHTKLQLTSHRIYEKSGTVLLTYAVSR